MTDPALYFLAGFFIARLFNVIRRLLVYSFDVDGVRAAWCAWDPYMGEPGARSILRFL